MCLSNIYTAIFTNFHIYNNSCIKKKQGRYQLKRYLFVCLLPLYSFTAQPIVMKFGMHVVFDKDKGIGYFFHSCRRSR